MDDQQWLDDWEKSPEEWAEAVEAAYGLLQDSGGVRDHLSGVTLQVVSECLAEGLIFNDGASGEIALVTFPRRLDWARRTVRPMLRIMGYRMIKGRRKIEWIHATGVDDDARLFALAPVQ